jgi:hypothetical protein
MILILECDHMFQKEGTDRCDTVTSWDSSAIQREQKDLFRKKVQTTLDSIRHTCLVAEEANEEQYTFAKEEAEKRCIPYANINLFRRQQRERGFPEKYLYLPEEEQMPFHQIRERHFLDQTLANLRSEGSVLFVCGKYHADNMERLFGANGFAVSMVRLLPEEGFDYEWYFPRFRGF